MAGIKGTILVSTEVLKQRAGTIKKKIDDMNAMHGELMQLLRGQKRYWQGERADAALQQCEKDRKNAEKILQRLKEYPEDLFQMAGIYEGAEAESTAESKPLIKDVIM